MKNNLLYLFVLTVLVNPFIAGHDLRVEKQPTQQLKDSVAAFALAFATSFVTSAIGIKLTPTWKQIRNEAANSRFLSPADPDIPAEFRDEYRTTERDGKAESSLTSPFEPLGYLAALLLGNISWFVKIKYLQTKHPIYSGIFGFLGSVIGTGAAAIFIQRPVKQTYI